jgi:RimJ/RimL family protein N-acetyltransferase
MDATITFRPFNLENDAEEFARLYSLTLIEPMTAATVRDYWTLRKDEIRVTTLAVDGEGRVIGSWDVDRETWMHAGRFYLKVIVIPERRRQGLGTEMYAAALEAACKLGATQLECSVREDDPAALRFARQRGFYIAYHSFESTLDLVTFDEIRFAPLLERVQAQGIRFFSLAEAGVTLENKQRLYEVNRSVSLDGPGSDGSFPDFAAFSKNVFEASWFRAEAQILAADGERYVGLAAISIYPEDRHAYNAITGVLREYRGRGLAQALKLQTILLAKKEGVRYMRTNNDSQNAPMLAINRKLGYQPQPGIYRIYCEV